MGTDRAGATRDREATERRILAEAARLFAEQGYRTVTVRAIAAAAAVNPALISRYYGSKLGLFDAVICAGRALPPLADTPVADLPRTLAEYAMRPRDTVVSRGVAAAIRSAHEPEVAELLRNRLERLLMTPIAGHLTGPDARRRAALCVALLAGVGSVRRVLDADLVPEDAVLADLTGLFAACLR